MFWGPFDMACPLQLVRHLYSERMGLLKELTLDSNVYPGKALPFDASVKIGSGKSSLKLKHRSPGNAMLLDAVHGPWNASVDLLSKDITIDYKRNVRGGELRVTQRVPKKQFFLVPSPEVKYLFTPVNLAKTGLKADATVAYDFQRRIASLTDDITYKGTHKLSVKADTKTGIKGTTYSLTSKLNKPWATSIGASFSQMAGPVVSYEVNLGPSKNAVKTNVALRLKTKDIKIDLAPKPIQKVGLTLTTTVRTDKLVPPSLLMGAKLTL